VIGVHSGSFWHRIVVFYDCENEGLWRITENQKEIIERHVHVQELSVDNYYPIVWSNWYEFTYTEYSNEELKTLEEGFAIRNIG
jgi:hypothetical protein